MRFLRVRGAVAVFENLIKPHAQFGLRFYEPNPREIVYTEFKFPEIKLIHGIRYSTNAATEALCKENIPFRKI
ncbi:hypothetical protein AgCh_033348 [Apium graveolens]